MTKEAASVTNHHFHASRLSWPGEGLDIRTQARNYRLWPPCAGSYFPIRRQRRLGLEMRLARNNKIRRNRRYPRRAAETPDMVRAGANLVSACAHICVALRNVRHVRLPESICVEVRCDPM